MPSQNGKRPAYQTVKEPKAAPSWLSLGQFAASNHIEWEEVVHDAWAAAVRAVTARGALLIFGATSDGGAIRLGVWDGEFRRWWYPRSAEDLTDLLRQLARAAGEVEE